jgi:hypothetical protein
MAFKMRGTPMQRNFGIGNSALPKKTKTLGTRTDYTEQEDKEVDTLTKTSGRTGKSKTRDISKRRADRIRDRQERRNRAADAPQEKMSKTVVDKVENPTMTMDEQGPVAVQEKKKSGPDWSTAPKSGTQARIDWYKKHNLAPDDTTKLKKVYDEDAVDSGVKEATADPNVGKTMY